jgi:hypothetical protein
MYPKIGVLAAYASASGVWEKTIAQKSLLGQLGLKVLHHGYHLPSGICLHLTCPPGELFRPAVDFLVGMLNFAIKLHSISVTLFAGTCIPIAVLLVSGS